MSTSHWKCVLGLVGPSPIERCSCQGHPSLRSMPLPAEYSNAVVKAEKALAGLETLDQRCVLRVLALVRSMAKFLELALVLHPASCFPKHRYTTAGTDLMRYTMHGLR